MLETGFMREYGIKILRFVLLKPVILGKQLKRNPVSYQRSQLINHEGQRDAHDSEPHTSLMRLR